MTVPNLKYNFHDAGLAQVKLGPRKEAGLTVILVEPVAPNNHTVVIRFGGISNFEQVQDYFQKIEAPAYPDACLARIDDLSYDQKEKSLANKLIFNLELDRFGSAQIRCRNISITRQ